MVGQRRAQGNRPMSRSPAPARAPDGAHGRILPRACPAVGGDRLSWRSAVTQSSAQARSRGPKSPGPGHDRAEGPVSRSVTRSAGPAAGPAAGPSAGPAAGPSGGRLVGRWAGALLLPLALATCYSGDFFDRLVDPDATAAFRITRLTLVDPHTYSGDALKCLDSTATFNGFFAESIDSFDVNTTLVLHPLDPSVDSGATMEIVPANCVPGGTLVNCTDKDVPVASIVSAEFNNSVGGTCGNPVAMSLNPDYHVEAASALNKPMSPCFLSALIPSLALGLAPTLTMTLSNVQIYAAYDLREKPGQLVEGVLFGFIPVGEAKEVIGTLNSTPFTLWSNLAGGGSCQPNMATPINDLDTVATPGDGVWMYFNFVAERVAWSSASDPEPGATTSSTATTGL